ncbi:MAG: DUF2341 domain-containing protein [Petrotogales bacterium]
MENMPFGKGIAFLVITLLMLTSFGPNITGYPEENSEVNTNFVEDCELDREVKVTCRTFGIPGRTLKEIKMPYSEVKKLFEKFNGPGLEIACDTLSEEINQLQQEIIDLADHNDLLPTDISVDDIQPSFASSGRLSPYSQQVRGSAAFCNFLTYGSGSQFPIIILPRLVPILLTPIPRAFMRWSATEGITRCGSLLTGKGFIAHGPQIGRALGFWGVGFSVFLPPVMEYGFIGYALFASCTAEKIELWPPNNPPVISSENPPSGTWDVPLSLSELKFRIEDADGDRMSYDVTTEPDIGSDSDKNKKDGVYSVSVGNLKPDKIYRWTVEVSDGKDTTVKQFNFITVAGPPFDPFDEGWQYRKKITIDYSQVAGDLTNFPVLISTLDTDLLDKAQDDGNDILFMEGSGVANKLYHEIEKYDGSSGELIAWLNVPSVSANEDTALYLYYGNSGCSNQQFSERVWDRNYKAVFHMNQPSSEHKIIDSTGNNNDGIECGNPTYQASGKIGYAIEFDRDGDFFNCGNVIDMGTTDFSLFALGTIYSLSNDEKPKIVGKMKPGYPYTGYHMGCSKEKHSKDFAVGVDAGANHHWAPSPDNTGWDDGNTWLFFNGRRDYDYPNNGDSTLYLDFPGQGESSSDTVSNVGNIDNNGNLYIGGVANKHSWDGKIDEVRITNGICRSDTWIETSYNTMNDPSSFLSFGFEESPP